MAKAKIYLKLGKLKFRCEGDEAWVANQLDKILNRPPERAMANSRISRVENIKFTISNKDVVINSVMC